MAVCNKEYPRIVNCNRARSIWHAVPIREGMRTPPIGPSNARLKYWRTCARAHGCLRRGIDRHYNSINIYTPGASPHIAIYILFRTSPKLLCRTQGSDQGLLLSRDERVLLLFPLRRGIQNYSLGGNCFYLA